MRNAHLVALSIAILSAGSAVAQELKTIEVRAEESERSIVMSCISPAEPSLKDVEQVLTISDPAMARGMRTKLMDAAAEACAKNEAKILVSRGANGALIWKPYKS
jgi:hypothetical protein